MEVIYTNILESCSSIIRRLIPSISPFDAVVAGTALWAFVKLIRISRRQVHTTKLRGPPSSSFIYGVGKMTLGVNDPSAVYESWAQQYGTVFEVPSTLGSRRIVLCDPKAIAHFHARDTWTYVRTPEVKVALEHAFGRGLFWADGESHKRQRKLLTPAFNIAAIRELTPIYYDSAHKAKGAWNALIESSIGDGTSAIIEVQNWMNYISLDTIGLAGFSHDFGALDGRYALVTQIFDSFSSSTASASNVGINLLAQAFPYIAKMPTRRSRMIGKLNEAMEEILDVLLAGTKKNIDSVGKQEEKSVIGLLIKGENVDSEFHLSKEEVLSQMKILLLAGYETTSISMTWALIELSRNPEVQIKLRNELLEYDSDPTYDQLANGLPYLDAVVHEVLRIHPPIRETARVALEDDVVPLAEPACTWSGQCVESLSIAKGTIVVVPMATVNVSSHIWGEDAKVFKPSRWLEDEHGHNGIPSMAREVVGHRHLLTFSDGPRTCLGKTFAVTEFKAVLYVLVKNFVFELPNGPQTKFEFGRGILPRPRIAGEEACLIPLRVRSYVE